MSSSTNLPIILVSARDSAAADAIISEIIDQPGPEIEDDDENPSDRTWHISNKYYSIDVRLRAVPDGRKAPAAPEPTPEAHIIYLTADECGAEAGEVVRRRSAAARGVEAGAVRLLAAERDVVPLALPAAPRYELVPLRPMPREEDEEDGEERGIERVRAALHAHAWPGLVRASAGAGAGAGVGGGACAGEEVSEEEAERWAALLGAVGEVRAAGWARGEGGEERLRRAEQLALAAAAALRLQPDDL